MDEQSRPQRGRGQQQTPHEEIYQSTVDATRELMMWKGYHIRDFNEALTLMKMLQTELAALRSQVKEVERFQADVVRTLGPIHVIQEDLGGWRVFRRRWSWALSLVVGGVLMGIVGGAMGIVGTFLKRPAAQVQALQQQDQKFQQDIERLQQAEGQQWKMLQDISKNQREGFDQLLRQYPRQQGILPQNWQEEEYQR